MFFSKIVRFLKMICFLESRMNKIAATLFLFLFTLNIIAEEDDNRPKLAVMEFEDKSGKFSDETLSNATEYLRSKFVSSNKFVVIAKARQKDTMIREMKKESHKLCNDQKCQIKLGQALSADTILNTTITSLGSKYTIASELIDLAKEAATTGATANFDGNEDSLIEVLDDIVAQILGKNKQSNFQTGRFGGKQEDWDIGGGEETVVFFYSNPAVAVVIVDGKIICQQTPCSKTLTLGKHTIEMQKEDYLPYSKTENITQGRTLNYTLEPDFALLSVQGQGEYQVSVILDGKFIGKNPITGKKIKPGKHKIEHRDNCFVDGGENFTVKRGETKEISLDLKHRESAIKVYAQDTSDNDIEADVFVDGRNVGRAPGKFKVPLCSKEMRVKKSGYDDYSEILSLKEHDVQTLHAKLQDYGEQDSWQPQQPDQKQEKRAENYQEKKEDKRTWDGGIHPYIDFEVRGNDIHFIDSKASTAFGGRIGSDFNLDVIALGVFLTFDVGVAGDRFTDPVYWLGGGAGLSKRFYVARSVFFITPALNMSYNGTLNDKLKLQDFMLTPQIDFGFSVLKDIAIRLGWNLGFITYSEKLLETGEIKHTKQLFFNGFYVGLGFYIW